MSHTLARHSFQVRLALVLGLTASSLTVGTSSADVIRDQWYLDATAPRVAPTLAVQARDTWYLDETAPALLLARSFQAQQDG
jgi:hypothetical protein